jgi:hypothetical protein
MYFADRFYEEVCGFQIDRVHAGLKADKLLLIHPFGHRAHPTLVQRIREVEREAVRA